MKRGEREDIEGTGQDPPSLLWSHRRTGFEPLRTEGEGTVFMKYWLGLSPSTLLPSYKTVLAQAYREAIHLPSHRLQSHFRLKGSIGCRGNI